MVKCVVFFAVRTEFLNIIYTCFGFKGWRSSIWLMVLCFRFCLFSAAWNPKLVSHCRIYHWFNELTNWIHGARSSLKSWQSLTWSRNSLLKWYPKIHHRVKKLSLDHTLSQLNLVCTQISCFYNHHLLLPSHLHLGLPNIIFCSAFQVTFYMHILLS
jgi:hypothetical protein